MNGSEPDLRGEYRFDYAKARPNRFVAADRPGTLAVVLDPDVAEVFRSDAAVNEVLRSIIRVWPASRRARASSTRSRQVSRSKSSKA